MSKFTDLTGQVFTRLTVIERAENDKFGKTQSLCKCICGKETIVSNNNLKGGNTRSCGCLQKERVSEIRSLPYGEAAFRIIYSRYKNNAKMRSIIWNLTIEQFKILTKGNCEYCGIEPLQIYKSQNNTGDYIYNGIDRVDNTLGYNIENCVSCCGKCNRMKGKLSKEEFLEHIKRIFFKEDNHGG